MDIGKLLAKFATFPIAKFSLHRLTKPEGIAEMYLRLAHESKSTWTYELDLRSASERF